MKINICAPYIFNYLDRVTAKLIRHEQQNTIFNAIPEYRLAAPTYSSTQ
jgi:hypothetical protein